MSATGQVSRALGVDRGPLGTSGFWLELSERAKRLARHEALDAQMAAALATARDRVESWHAATEFDFGLMHGDWAPWNMASAGSSLAVWDWERSRIRGPIGFDGLFFRFQVDLWIRSLTPEQALDRTRHSLSETMAASGAAARPAPPCSGWSCWRWRSGNWRGWRLARPCPAGVYRSLTGLLEQADEGGWSTRKAEEAQASP